MILTLRTDASKSTRGRRLALDEDIDIAFDLSYRAENIARTNRVSQSTVRSKKLQVGEARLKLDLLNLDEAIKECREHPPLAVWAALKHDSAKIPVSAEIPVATGNTMTNIQEQSVWHTLLSRQLVVIVNEAETKILELVSPSQLLITPSAVALHGAFFGSEPFAQIAKKIEELKETAVLKGTTYGQDGAYGNERFYHGIEGEEHCKRAGTMNAKLTCGNHGNGITEETTCGMNSTTLNSRVYCSANFLKMGGHHTRMKQVLNSIAKQKVVIIKGERPVEAVQFQEVAIDYFVETFMQFKVPKSAKDDASFARARLKQKMLWTSFFAIANGRI